MYKKIQSSGHRIRVNKAIEGERIEVKVNRIVNNKEPIKDGAPLIYTERKDGVNPAMDIRTDKWELALEKMHAVNQAAKDDRQARLEGFKNSLDKHNQELKKKANENKNDGGAEPTGGTKQE